MISELERYLSDHPELKKLSDCPDAEILKWADRKKYIKLRKFYGKFLYTKSQVEDAKMWAEKDASAKTLLARFKLLVQYNNNENDFVLYARYKTEGDAMAMGHLLMEDKKSEVVDFDIIKD